MRKLFLLALCLAAVGCGTETKNLSKKDKTPPKDKPPVGQCPGGKLDNLHEVSLRMKAAPPPRIAFEIDGKREIDECKKLPEEPPEVSVDRKAGNELLVKVLHLNFFRELPKDISFKLISLNDCAGPEKTIYEAARIPLEFKDDFPNGVACPGRAYAKLSFVEQ